MVPAVFKRFHPLIAEWFTSHVGEPTPVQVKAWPHITDDSNVLVTAPTGSGKTFTAFLWAINRMVTGELAPGETRVLYVSPLKALNNDIRRNLIHPLEELKSFFEAHGQKFPEIHALTRSGDTLASERRSMLKHPPEILITTPESLNLLISASGSREKLTRISTVILDEIHSVFGTRRGVFLMTAVERLTLLSGEFQRIALSATVRPLDSVARFVGGYYREDTPEGPAYHPRPVEVLEAQDIKEYDIRIHYPGESMREARGENFWDPLVSDFKKIIRKNRSTLFFVNGRRICEKIAMKINQGEEHPVAYAHHGSLSRELRLDVEKRLKAGDLRAIVATNTLELGIDIGALDEVILIQTAPSLSAAVQRIGRAGHKVGEVSRGSLFPVLGFDFIEAAVLAAGIRSHDIEATRPVENALDILAQVIISMTAQENWRLDSLYHFLRCSSPYHSLPRKHFDRILDMLDGRYRGSRIRSLEPRVSVDRIARTVTARRGALMAVFTSGGVIPDRGYFQLRHQDNHNRIGELDEEFVWEAKIGQTFTFGTQNWRIQKITHNDVLAVPAPGSASAPFWRAEERNRDFYFSIKIAEFLEMANSRVEEDDFPETLRTGYFMDEASALELIRFLKNQRLETRADLPHRHHLLIEHVETGPGGAPGNQIVIHAPWGGRVNRPWAMALETAWEQRYGQKLEIFASNTCLICVLPHPVSGDELISLVHPGNIPSLLRSRLEGSGFFGARFRECAGRALLITRQSFNRRMPLWMIRLKSQKLFNAVQKYPDFPILLETWRTCLKDEFDLEALGQILSELERGEIRMSECTTPHPSPMVKTLTWKQINQYMYRDDEPLSEGRSGLRDNLIQDVLRTPALRPRMSRNLVKTFMEKRQRLSPGYAPSSAPELIDWVKERVAVPEGEWNTLLSAMKRDHALDTGEVLASVSERIVKLNTEGLVEPLVISLEKAAAIKKAFFPHKEAFLFHLETGRSMAFPQELRQKNDESQEIFDMLGEWLSYYGPVKCSFIEKALGMDRNRLSLILEDLEEAEGILRGNLTDTEDASGKPGIRTEEICDSENFELLLRISRQEAVPQFQPLPAEALPLFLAEYQGITEPGNRIEDLARCLEKLFFYPASAGLWETEILPARLRSYENLWLDTLMRNSLLWLGRRGDIAFCLAEDMDLAGDEPDAGGKDADIQTVLGLFRDRAGRYDFSSLLQVSGVTAAQLSLLLWKAVWKGKISNDTFSALRQGILTGFKVPEVIPARPETMRPVRRLYDRTRFSRWKGALPYSGNWFILDREEPKQDLVDAEERNRNRVRLLLERYGILFRELLQRESPEFQWSAIFRSLRLMELSGEVLSGYFFEGIPGPQFLAHRAMHMLRKGLPDDAIYWINAADPASCCGIPVEGLKERLPRRLDSHHLVYRGKELVLISERRGKTLTFFIPPDDPEMPGVLGIFHHLLSRSFMPLRRITIETINGEDGATSPYLENFREAFDLSREHKVFHLHRKL